MTVTFCQSCGRRIGEPGGGRPPALCTTCRALPGNPRYGADHRRLREEWAARIESGEAVRCHAAVCLERSPWIAGEWDLGHTPDGLAWTGPEHPKCNRADGGRRSRGPRLMPVRVSWKTSRSW